MILDQTDKETPVRKTSLRWLESLLVSLILLAAILRILHTSYAYEISLIFWNALGLTYLFVFYWVDTPSVFTRRTISITIAYGISFAVAVFSPSIIGLFPEYVRQITAAIVIIFILITLIDRSSSSDAQVGTTRIYVRMIIFSFILTLRVLVYYRLTP